MKFGKYLERHQVSEWKKKYVYYKLFKKQIKAIRRASFLSDNISVTGTLKKKFKNIVYPDHGIELERVAQQLGQSGDAIGSGGGGSGGGGGVGEGVETSSSTSPPTATASSTGTATATSNKAMDAEIRKFEQMLNDEYDKVNNFYKESEEEFIRQFTLIREMLLHLPDKKQRERSGSISLSKLDASSSHPNLLSSLLTRRAHAKSSPRIRSTSSPMPSPYLGQPNIEHSIEELIQPAKKQSDARSAETFTFKLKPTKIKRSLKRALQENYREIEILKEYVNLNHTAFRKIFKKFDKTLGTQKSDEFMDRTQSQYFYTSKKINAIEHEIEVLFTDIYNEGNRREAMNKLRVNQDYQTPAHIVFQTGFLTGASIILFIFCVRYMVGNVSIFRFDSPTPIDFLSMFILFRCLLLPIVMLWYFGVLMYVCKGKKINDILILEWDPRTETNYQHILRLASALTFLWNVALYLYVYLGTHVSGRVPIIFPFLLFVSALLYLFCPFNIFKRSSRHWLIHTFGRMLCAPFLAVKFKDFFLGDQFTSLALVLSDFEYTLCYFVHDFWYQNNTCWSINPYIRPILISIPPLIRALQSLRRYRDSKQRIHMLNFGKYCATITATTASAIAHSGLSKGGAYIPLIAVWILLLCVSSLYGCSWDFIMDWDVLHRDSRNFMLRDKLVYSHRGVYYFAIVSNIVLRASWAVNLSFEAYSSREKELIVLITGLLEVTRRFQWNFFRLENEHLNNVGKFRAFNLRLPEMFPTDYNPLSTSVERSHDQQPLQQQSISMSNQQHAASGSGEPANPPPPPTPQIETGSIIAPLDDKHHHPDSLKTE
ncbi:hypothetical protein SAMD00019534_030810 [Acytostelium subglobosum LB1]|uniref:hypothetical protein n=1 Tax=Acytostelium subglobosum LB1 TaxID=1410327 RepID=UPI000644DB61|nr:hypothetical protein SAMD00019534_030810 [Acytostelium subglobosum LB1]GAM19906.1 hypothetical protein SAMD00019534_030810 [Acytostelium subglobosum LB1]|eukprot:XP_012756668.1 hypothetical protein SAMD00019534_030810 [Acytostelium subglobosum LB1]